MLALLFLFDCICKRAVDAHVSGSAVSVCSFVSEGEGFVESILKLVLFKRCSFWRAVRLVVNSWDDRCLFSQWCLAKARAMVAAADCSNLPLCTNLHVETGVQSEGFCSVSASNLPEKVSESIDCVAPNTSGLERRCVQVATLVEEADCSAFNVSLPMRWCMLNLKLALNLQCMEQCVTHSCSTHSPISVTFPRLHITHSSPSASS